MLWVLIRSALLNGTLRVNLLSELCSLSVCSVALHCVRALFYIVHHIEGWSQDCSKSDGCFSQYLISSPLRHYEDYNISFCKQWKFRCHCSYEQWHLNLHCLQRVKVAPKQGFQKYVWVTTVLRSTPDVVFTGFVQFVDSVPVAEVLDKEGSIQNYFKKQAPAEGAPYGIAPEIMDNYIKSCGKWENYKWY